MGERNARSSQKILSLLTKPRRFLFTILTGNTLVNTAATSLGTVFSMSLFGGKGLPIAIGSMFFIIILFGEVLPKSYAYMFAQGFSSYAIYPLEILIKIFTPIRQALYAITDNIIKRFGFMVPQDNPEITEDEIKSVIKISHREGVVKETEKDLIYGVLRFRGQRARDIMSPKIHIKAINFDLPQEKVVEYAKEARHSRLPVFRDSLDNIIGIAHTKDILFNPGTNLKDIMKEAHFIPESETIDMVMADLQKRSIQMVIVTDEYGVTTGVVTMEDILEEIVGEISGEFDREEALITKIGDAAYRLGGTLKIEEANKKLRINIRTHEVETIGGFISLILQKIPKENDEIVFEGYKFRVSKTGKNRINEIIAEKQ